MIAEGALLQEIAYQAISKQREFMHPWKNIEVSVAPLQDRREILLQFFGVTEDDRFFKTWCYIPAEDFDADFTKLKSFLESKAINALLSLDTYLDPQCQCKPTPGKLIGNHCEYHKKRLGY